jgi:hypothetical protein
MQTYVVSIKYKVQAESEAAALEIVRSNFLGSVNPFKHLLYIFVKEEVDLGWGGSIKRALTGK